jgi:hypothetical protein
MRKRLGALLESAVIGLGLLSFWPLILGYDGFWYQCGILGVLVLLSIVAVARFRRVRGALGRENELVLAVRRPEDSENAAGEAASRRP